MINSDTGRFRKSFMKIWGTNKIPQKQRDFRASTWIKKLVLKSCSYANFGHLMQSTYYDTSDKSLRIKLENVKCFHVAIEIADSVWF